MHRRTFLKGMLFGLTPLPFSSFVTNTDQPKGELPALSNHEKVELISNKRSSFEGCFLRRIDSKGRIVIPARFRAVIRSDGDGGMVCRMDRGLIVYTFEEWDEVKQRILSISKQSENMRRFRRIFIGGSHDCCCDKRGRILIPHPLRLYAELEKEIVLAGLHDHFEIWSLKNWNKEVMHMKQDMKNENIRSEVVKLLY